MKIETLIKDLRAAREVKNESQLVDGWPVDDNITDEEHAAIELEFAKSDAYYWMQMYSISIKIGRALRVEEFERCRDVAAFRSEIASNDLESEIIAYVIQA